MCNGKYLARRANFHLRPAKWHGWAWSLVALDVLELLELLELLDLVDLVDPVDPLDLVDLGGRGAPPPPPAGSAQRAGRPDLLKISFGPGRTMSMTSNFELSGPKIQIS